MGAPLVAELVDEADVVSHLAAAVGVELIVESPVRTIETNVHCTEVLMKQPNKKQQPGFLASTSEGVRQGREAALSGGRRSPARCNNHGLCAYACSKALDEYLGLAHKEKGVPVVVGRLFNTVGPRQTGRYGMVVSSFVR